MRILRFSIAVVCLLNAFFTNSALADVKSDVSAPIKWNLVASEQSFSNPPIKLVVGVEDVSYFPLFDFKHQHDTFTTELLRKFGEQYNYEFEYLAMPVKRFGMWLFEKDIDLKFPDNSRWNESDEVNLLSKNITYSLPVLDLVAGTITADSNIKAKQDIKIMGTLLGFHPTKWLDEVTSGQVILYESSSTMMLIQQLIRGQLDAINLEPSVVNHYLSLINKEGVANINKHFDYEVYSYHLSTVKHPSVIAEFNTFLQNNQSALNALKNKYKIIDPTPYRKP
ncbi:hypothetical protein J1N51_02695 [Psychrosphaera ytuae]|uniref:Solute-binding protein family 3/N-terminal domain-containing protein n=1 Tax=Psychrosphaera ytuae TaxID=2820710 RepID=A0A975DC39_9GAMM|nr:hypothetical protein [Psychrosphaera ytuae]QTH64412.1 hypothetical protein J1N51_02695 [Psychrosphaera ytuae]